MTLTRIWYPSPNYSTPRAQNRLIIIHTSEGATTEAGLAGFCQGDNNGNPVSYHVCFDDFGDQNTITEMLVSSGTMAWAAMDANDWGVHGCCCCAGAAWTEDEWYAHPVMLEKCAAWIAEEADRYGIPLEKVTADDIRAGRSGVCGHRDCTDAGAGGDHWDPGYHFPFGYVLSLAIRISGGGAAPTPPTLTTPDLWWLGADMPFHVRNAQTGEIRLIGPSGISMPLGVQQARAWDKALAPRPTGGAPDLTRDEIDAIAATAAQVAP